MNPKTLIKRNEQSSQNCWNVTAIYPSFKEWSQKYEEIIESPEAPFWPSFASYRGHLHESAVTLKKALELFFSLSRKLEKLFTYAHLRHDEDITEDLPRTNYQKIRSRIYDFQQESAWLEPEILHLSSDLLKNYLRDPLLSEYRFFIEKIIRRRPHTLSTEQEELMAMVQKPLQTTSSAFSAFNNADLKFADVEDQKGERHPLSHALYSLYLRSHDRTLRKNAFQSMQRGFLHFENTLCELIQGKVKTHYFEAKARNFKSSLEAALFTNNIPTSVYHSLIQTVRSHLPKLHQYIALRKKILKVDELHLYDMYVPLLSEVDMSLSYSEAEELVIASVAPLGKEYQNSLQEGLQKRAWVDRFENQNKRSGAYSSGCYDSDPYILMNYNNTVRDLFTLAHEAGHSMHSLLSKKHQRYQDSQYPIFVAEVASTFNEALLMDLLLTKRSKKEERLFLINEQLENMRATLFRQTMFAEFELAIHSFVEQGTPLTPSLLKKTYIELNRDYFGPDAFIDEEIAIEWARIPHFYYNFYVYQYATGISAAITLANKVLKQEPDATENYLSFLKGGASLFPIDLLKMAGIDVTTAEPFEIALSLFEEKVHEFEKNI